MEPPGSEAVEQETVAPASEGAVITSPRESIEVLNETMSAASVKESCDHELSTSTKKGATTGAARKRRLRRQRMERRARAATSAAIVPAESPMPVPDSTEENATKGGKKQSKRRPEVASTVTVPDRAVRRGQQRKLRTDDLGGRSCPPRTRKGRPDDRHGEAGAPQAGEGARRASNKHLREENVGDAPSTASRSGLLLLPISLFRIFG